MNGMRTARIDVIPLPDGLFRARCGEMGLLAEASTPQEAEAILRRLMEERVELAGTAASPSVVAGDPDVLPGADQDEI